MRQLALINLSRLIALATDLAQCLGGALNEALLIVMPSFRPLQLPIVFETSVAIQDRGSDVWVTPSGLKVTPSTLWMAADTSLTPRTAAPRPGASLERRPPVREDPAAKRNRGPSF